MSKTVVQFDREKFKEAVWLIASYCPPDELGNVKLHKMLYYSDMLYFLHEGRALTGVDYIKQKFGPVARHLSAAVRELVAAGILNVTEEEYFGLYKKNYISLVEYQRNRLSLEEVRLIKDVADFVRGKSAREISEFSHNAVWEAAEIGESLPYFTALRLVPTETNELDRSWAIETARKYASERPW